jgi:hypothetical protein
MTTFLWALLIVGLGAGAFALKVLQIIGSVWEASENDDRPWGNADLPYPDTVEASKKNYLGSDCNPSDRTNEPLPAIRETSNLGSLDSSPADIVDLDLPYNFECP